MANPMSTKVVFWDPLRSLFDHFFWHILCVFYFSILCSQNTCNKFGGVDFQSCEHAKCTHNGVWDVVRPTLSHSCHNDNVAAAKIHLVIRWMIIEIEYGPPKIYKIFMVESEMSVTIQWGDRSFTVHRRKMAIQWGQIFNRKHKTFHCSYLYLRSTLYNSGFRSHAVFLASSRVSNFTAFGWRPCRSICVIMPVLCGCLQSG